MLILALSLGDMGVASPSARGQEDTGQERLPVNFLCDESGTDPMTIARSPNGDLPVVRWQYTGFRDYPPLTRCRMVSPRFQEYDQNGTLVYMTTGWMNQQPVICVASSLGGECTGLLLTLRHEGDNPQEVLERLIGVRDYGETALVHYREKVAFYDRDGDLYINMEELLSLRRRQQSCTPGSWRPCN